MKDARAIQQVFERYQRERTAFVGSVYELARHDSNCELIEAVNGIHFLQSCLTDPLLGIRRTAALALGRLAAHSEVTSNKIIADGAAGPLIEFLVQPYSDAIEPSHDAARRREGLELRRAAAFALRNVCKHGKHLTLALVNGVHGDVIQVAARCLETPDAETKEGAAWLLDSVAGYGEELADKIIETQAIYLLVSCLQYSEIGLKRAATSALGTIASYGNKYAHAVSMAGSIPLLCAMLPQSSNSDNSIDVRLCRHVCCTLSLIVHDDVELAKQLVATGALPAIVQQLSSQDELVQRFAASTLRDVACHDVVLAREVANIPNCLALLVQVTQTSRGLNALPSIMALGYICSHSAELAKSIIDNGGLTALAIVIAHNAEEPSKSAAAWAVGHAGRHGPQHAQSVAESGALLALTSLKVASESTDDLKVKCSRAVCSVLAQLTSLPALDALLRMPVSPTVKSAVLDRLSVILNMDNGNLRTLFVQNGCLQLVQELAEETGSAYVDHVAKITRNFPLELVNRYSPAYNKSLLERLASNPTHNINHQQAAVPMPEKTTNTDPGRSVSPSHDVDECNFSIEERKISQLHIHSEIAVESFPSTDQKQSSNAHDGGQPIPRPPASQSTHTTTTEHGQSNNQMAHIASAITTTTTTPLDNLATKDHAILHHIPNENEAENLS